MWSDWTGQMVRKHLFEVKLVRKIQDCFTNVHNQLLTLLFLCNNNVLTAMTGAAVLYVTGYQFKKNQKEERVAFERVANVLLQTIEVQVRRE